MSWFKLGEIWWSDDNQTETGIVRGLQNKLNVAYVIVSAF